MAELFTSWLFSPLLFNCQQYPTASASLVQRSSISSLTFSHTNESTQERETERSTRERWMHVDTDMKKDMANAKNAVEDAKNASTKPAGWKQDLARIQAGDGKKQNDHIDYTAMTATAISALLSNAFLCATVLGLFSVLHNRYPLVFRGNVLEGKVPMDLDRNWIASSLAVDLDKIESELGLDACMAIKYSSLGAQLMLTIGIPNLLFFSPLHRWYGGGGLEHTDLFASWSMANIKMYHPWLYHLHAIAVIWAVLAVRKLVFQAQSRFVTKRMSWMKGLQYPRANTVLVEEIPKDHRSREQLLKFFCDNLGPDSVVCVEMVMQTKALEDSLQLWKNAKTKLAESKGYFEKEGLRPTLGRFQGFPRNLYCFGPHSADRADAIDHFAAEVVKYELQIKEMREAINREAQRGEGDQNTHSAFVTFRSRKNAEIAKALEFSGRSEWVILEAPEASAIRWEDLSEEEARSGKTVAVGYLLMLFLLANFSPICLAISSAASEIDMGRLQPIWAALAPTLGLTVFLAMLPTVLLLIFSNFFTLRSEPLAQHRLQVWYFHFQAICILFLPIVGSDFRNFAKQLLQDSSPFSVLKLLADRIPLSSQFFFSFVVLQWSVACMEILRMAVLGKFLLFRAMHTEKEARDMAEPEDQEFYGMGGRFARWSLNLVIGCIFCGVWPLVTLVTLVQFLLQRVAYGYLFAFAETKKADSGGEFWSECYLLSVPQLGVGMCGLLLHRSSSLIPAAVAFAGVVIAVISVWQFQTSFRWRSLPIPEVVAIDRESLSKAKATEPDAGIYKHPALRDDSDLS
eukprot:s1724_g19.t1